MTILEAEVHPINIKLLLKKIGLPVYQNNDTMLTVEVDRLPSRCVRISVPPTMRCTDRPVQVVCEDGASYDESLSRLEAVDTGEDVDAVGAEDGQGHHVALREGDNVLGIHHRKQRASGIHRGSQTPQDLLGSQTSQNLLALLCSLVLLAGIHSCAFPSILSHFPITQSNGCTCFYIAHYYQCPCIRISLPCHTPVTPGTGSPTPGTSLGAPIALAEASGRRYRCRQSTPRARGERRTWGGAF